MPAHALIVTILYANALNITTQPANKEIICGESAALSVTAKLNSSLASIPTYQWYQVDGETETDLKGKTDSPLSRTGLNVGEYTYNCKVSYGGITVSSRCTTAACRVRGCSRIPLSMWIWRAITASP